jgi:hypothetical protein
MEKRIRGHFSEAQYLMVILEKPTAFVVKIAKKSRTEPFSKINIPSNSVPI